MFRSITTVLTRSTTVLVGTLAFTCFAAVVEDAPGERGKLDTDGGGHTASTRELWRVLFGAAATVVALHVCAIPWERCLIHLNGDGAFMFCFVERLAKVLAPAVCMPWFLTAAYAAVVLRGRQKNSPPIISKRLSPMVVWIGIDADTYDSFFGQQGSTSVEINTAGNINDKLGPVVGNEGQGTGESRADNTNDTAGSPVRKRLVITDLEKITVQEFFKHVVQLRTAPDLKAAVPWPGSKLWPEEDHQPYYFGLQGWDGRTMMWKEAMVVKGALGTEQNISKWMGMVKVMPWWARALLVVQGLGYDASVLSRFVHHLSVSPLELICLWLLLLVVVDAGLLSLLVIPSYQGIHLRLDHAQFHEVVQEYIKLTEEHAQRVLTCLELWSFVFCILFTFVLFLILIPPLIFYYYRLPTSILTFISLVLLAVSAGCGIVSYALVLFSSPHHTALAFFHVCRPPSFPCMLVLTLSLLLIGLASYILAVTDTTMNWSLFEMEDHSFFSFMFPHIGS